MNAVTVIPVIASSSWPASSLLETVSQACSHQSKGPSLTSAPVLLLMMGLPYIHTPLANSMVGTQVALPQRSVPSTHPRPGRASGLAGSNQRRSPDNEMRSAARLNHSRWFW
jgi:hypothetical protein